MDAIATYRTTSRKHAKEMGKDVIMLSPWGTLEIWRGSRNSVLRRMVTKLIINRETQNKFNHKQGRHQPYLLDPKQKIKFLLSRAISSFPPIYTILQEFDKNQPFYISFSPNFHQAFIIFLISFRTTLGIMISIYKREVISLYFSPTVTHPLF